MGRGIRGNKKYCKGPYNLTEDESNLRVNGYHQRFLKD